MAERRNGERVIHERVTVSARRRPRPTALWRTPGPPQQLRLALTMTEKRAA